MGELIGGMHREVIPTKDGGTVVAHKPTGLYARDLYASGEVVPIQGVQKGTLTDAAQVVNIGDFLGVAKGSPRWALVNSDGEPIGRATDVGSKALAGLTRLHDDVVVVVTSLRRSSDQAVVNLGGLAAPRAEALRLATLL